MGANTGHAAGASAAAEYERRWARDRQRARERFPVALTLVVGSGVGVFLLVMYGVPVLLDGMVSAVVPAEQEAASVSESFAGSLWKFAAFFGLASAFSVGRTAWGRRSTTEAWRVGAVGEQMTGRELERLEKDGFRTLHDLQLPGSRANIDHVVIGPTGVFTVETKSYAGRVVIERTTVKHNGRRRDKIVPQALGQAAAVRAVLGDELRTLGVDILPVVCVHRATIRTGWFQKPVIEGVRFCSGRGLAKTLRGCPRLLTPDDVEGVCRAVTVGFGASK